MHYIKISLLIELDAQVLAYHAGRLTVLARDMDVLKYVVGNVVKSMMRSEALPPAAGMYYQADDGEYIT